MIFAHNHVMTELALALLCLGPGPGPELDNLLYPELNLSSLDAGTPDLTLYPDKPHRLIFDSHSLPSSQELSIFSCLSLSRIKIFIINKIGQIGSLIGEKS